jgi:hypothetical protein
MNVAAMPRPRNVTVAVVILCVALIVHLVSGSIFAAFTQAAGANKPFGVFAYINVALGFCINAFLLYMIFRRHNWARVLYLVFFVLISLLSLPGGVIAFFMSPIWGSLYLLVYIAQIVALVLLFSWPGSAWFKPQVV